MGVRKKQLYNDKNIFFITTVCYHWLPLLTIGNSMQIISESLNFSVTKYGATILGYVLMPNHIHLIVHFVNGKDRVGFMRGFKSYTSRKVRQELELQESAYYLQAISYKDQDQQYKVWHDRFDEVYLESRELLEIKLNYIHNNPLQSHWNLVKKPSDYLYSSARYYEAGTQNEVIVRHYRDFV